MTTVANDSVMLSQPFNITHQGRITKTQYRASTQSNKTQRSKTLRYSKGHRIGSKIMGKVSIRKKKCKKLPFDCKFA